MAQISVVRISPPSDDQPDELASTKNYAKIVLAHSYRTKEDSLFPGSNYWHLAQYLNSTPSPRPSSPDLRQQTNHDFVVLHTLSPEPHASSIIHFDAGLAGLAELTAHHQPGEDAAQLLFLRGFPSPEWLALIGSRYRIDPEYLRRHLDFGQVEDFFDLPGTPLSSRNIVQLPVYTIGVNNAIKYSNKDFSAIREQTAEETRTQLRRLLTQGLVGESIVRRHHVHDDRYISLEQQISVCVEKKQGVWTAVVWLDGGRDLAESGNGLFTSHSAGHQRLQRWFLPVIQHKARSALNFHPADRTANRAGVASLRTNNTLQSASSLPRLYGQTLKRDVAKVDAFYALSELFAFAAASQYQMLNFLDKQIANEAKVFVADLQISLANLQYIKSILETHVNSIVATIACIDSRGGPKWPRATDKAQQELVDQTARDLKWDYEELQRRANNLSNRCSNGMDLIMNRAMLAESQQTSEQARGVARLTLLAFLFIPLSFSTSIFGMNFRELGNNKPDLSIWIWFAVAVPIFTASLVLCFRKELQQYARRLMAPR